LRLSRAACFDRERARQGVGGLWEEQHEGIADLVHNAPVVVRDRVANKMRIALEDVRRRVVPHHLGHRCEACQINEHHRSVHLPQQTEALGVLLYVQERVLPHRAFQAPPVEVEKRGFDQ
jgi:hypothetical protein